MLPGDELRYSANAPSKSTRPPSHHSRRGPGCPRPQVEFATDSSLEGAGFEPSVPRKPRLAFGYSLLIMKSLSAADSPPIELTGKAERRVSVQLRDLLRGARERARRAGCGRSRRRPAREGSTRTSPFQGGAGKVRNRPWFPAKALRARFSRRAAPKRRALIASPWSRVPLSPAPLLPNKAATLRSLIVSSPPRSQRLETANARVLTKSDPPKRGWPCPLSPGLCSD